MKKEEWRPAPPPYEGIIEVSDLGRIRRAKPMRGGEVGTIFSPIHLNGRMYVGVTVSYKQRENIHVANLVASVFCRNGLGRPVEYGKRSDYIVRFRDGNIKNCAVSNLEWVKRAGSFRRDPATALHGEKHQSAKLTQTQADAIRAEYDRGGVIQGQLAKKYGVSRALISRICRGKSYRKVEGGKNV
jgi:hypothetical protein